MKDCRQWFGLERPFSANGQMRNMRQMSRIERKKSDVADDSAIAVECTARIAAIDDLQFILPFE